MQKQQRVMLVEDSPTQAKRLRVLLEDALLDVIHVTSAEAALDQLERVRPEIIVLDYYLPAMNGDEFCRQIKLNVNTRAIPVLMLTVEGSDAAQMRGLDSGADDYLAKSADPDILLVRIRSLMRKSEGTPGTIVDVENRFNRVRVLTIDDSPTYAYYLAQELSSEHYVVETALDPQEGLRRVAEASFDCVLVDFEMPGMDGAEVCRRIRQMRSETDPQIVLIMLSSHDDKDHMTLGFEAGADDYIAKSSDSSVTKSRIRALLRRKFLVEENRRILDELKEKELQAVRARAEREAAEVRALMADQLAAANRELEYANRRLDRANQELEQFAYSAAHDLQEPLRMVGVYSQLLQRRYEGKLDQQADQFIGYCVEGAARMDRLIQDLLVYARAASVAEQVADPLDLNVVLKEALGNLKASLEESHSEVTHGDLPKLVVDEVRIRQLFQNLIGNAVKYRRPADPPKIRVSADRSGNEWVFSVADNGIGIAPEFRDQVFASFKRLHNDKYSGTGLGLSICQRIVEGYGGRIWVESAVNEGSTFYFTLPARLEKVAAIDVCSGR